MARKKEVAIISDAYASEAIEKFPMIIQSPSRIEQQSKETAAETYSIPDEYRTAPMSMKAAAKKLGYKKTPGKKPNYPQWIWRRVKAGAMRKPMGPKGAKLRTFDSRDFTK